jgi:hypothetical protein
MQHLDDNIHDTAPDVQIAQFLRWLYGNDPPGWLTLWLLPSTHTHWFRATNLDKAADYAAQCATHCDVYFGVGLRRDRLVKGRGESTDVIALPGLYIDIDLKHPAHTVANLPATIEEARQLLSPIDLPPSLILHSGHGLHVWWLLRELWCFESAAERHQAAQLNARLQATIQQIGHTYGWHVDGTADLARVLRLPGTRNRKHADAVMPVTLLEVNPERRYNPRDFESSLIELDLDAHHQHGQPSTASLPNNLPHVELAPLAISATIKFLIATGTHPQGKSYPTRSEAVWHALRALIAAGYDEATIASILLDPAYRISERPREKGRAWLAQELARARTKVRSRARASQAEPQHEPAETTADPSGDGTPRPVIQMSTSMTAMVDELQQAISRLSHGPHLFQRARQLCVIARGITPPKWLRRSPEAPTIMPVSPAYLRELATQAAIWEKYDKRAKSWDATLPPTWIIDTLYARPSWTFPSLEGVVCAPTLRPDGSLLSTPGYDWDTGLYLDLNGTRYPSICAHPTLDDARTAIGMLDQRGHLNRNLRF